MLTALPCPPSSQSSVVGIYVILFGLGKSFYVFLLLVMVTLVFLGVCLVAKMIRARSNC